MHSANWDHSVDLDNKTIGVIGVGSTSVQIVPQLQKIAKQVQVYMRSPSEFNLGRTCLRGFGSIPTLP